MLGKKAAPQQSSAVTPLPVEDDEAARRSRQKWIATMRGTGREGTALSGRGGDTSAAPTRGGLEASRTVLG